MFSRKYKHPRILDGRIALVGYDRPLRQVIATDLGHEEPTILLTNQLTKPPAKLLGRYAKRMIIENSIADGIDFFHMDALSSAVAMKVNCDLQQLTLMASSLYRLLASRIGQGYEQTSTGICFEISWMRPPRCGSPSRRSWCAIRSVLITPCSSRPASIGQTWSFPGWAVSDCDSSSGSRILPFRVSVV